MCNFKFYNKEPIKYNLIIFKINDFIINLNNHVTYIKQNSNYNHKMFNCLYFESVISHTFKNAICPIIHYFYYQIYYYTILTYIIIKTNLKFFHSKMIMLSYYWFYLYLLSVMNYQAMFFLIECMSNIEIHLMIL